MQRCAACHNDSPTESSGSSPVRSDLVVLSCRAVGGLQVNRSYRGGGQVDAAGGAAMHPHRSTHPWRALPPHPGVLVGNRNQRLVIPLAIIELPDSLLQAAHMCGVGMQRRLQRTSGALDQQRAQIDVAPQAHVSEPRPATGAVLARREAKPCTELSAIAEDACIGNCGSQRTGGHRPDAKQFAGASRDVTAAGVSGDRWSKRASHRFSAASCLRTSEIRLRSHDANRSALDQHRKHCTCCAKSRDNRKDDRRMAGNIDDAADDRFADAGEHV